MIVIGLGTVVLVLLLFFGYKSIKGFNAGTVGGLIVALPATALWFILFEVVDVGFFASIYLTFIFGILPTNFILVPWLEKQNNQ